MTTPGQPTEKSGVSEWDACFDHDMWVDIGPIGKGEFAQEMWTCNHKDHGRTPPIFYVHPNRPEKVSSAAVADSSIRWLTWYYLSALTGEQR